MARLALLLRGINIGPNRRIPMAQLRTALTDAGHEDVETYLQSGNIVLSSPIPSAALATAVTELIEERFGFDVPVIVRSAKQLAAVVAYDPLSGAADDPKRYQVTFLAAPPDAVAIQHLKSLAADAERVAVHGREIYTHHPEGIARSKLAAALGSAKLGPGATARNWTTVLKLAELASS